MAKAWLSVTLIVETYKDTGTCILKGIDDYMNLLDEQITMTQAMAFSAFKGRQIYPENHELFFTFLLSHSHTRFGLLDYCTPSLTLTLSLHPTSTPKRPV
jgi:hypothetical protein